MIVVRLIRSWRIAKNCVKIQSKWVPFIVQKRGSGWLGRWVGPGFSSPRSSRFSNPRVLIGAPSISSGENGHQGTRVVVVVDVGNVVVVDVGNIGSVAVVV